MPVEASMANSAGTFRVMLKSEYGGRSVLKLPQV